MKNEKMRSKLVVAIIGSIALVCVMNLGLVAKTILKSKPNILLIITDQQTADAMSCAGNIYLKTPAMDKLAENGIRFTNNYVSQPLCLPFRSSFQTGRYPHELGATNNLKKILGEFPLLGNLVAQAGYQCSYIGKWHVGTSPEKAGYIDFTDCQFDHEKTKLAKDYLLQKHESPFFLTVSYTNPHNVCELARANGQGDKLPDGSIGLPPEESEKLPPLPKNFGIPESEPSVIREVQGRYKSLYPTKTWDEHTWRQYLWGYYRLVEKVDNEIFQVIDALEQGGYANNTIIIFTSDHGEGVAMRHWNQKQVLYDQVVKTPCIINWKGITTKSINDELVVNALDIPATILDIVDVDIPSSMHGKSLVSLVKGEKTNHRKFLVTETVLGGVNANDDYARGRMIRTDRYKYCIYEKGDYKEQLFDMLVDPFEMTNLVYSPKHQKTLKKHRTLIKKWAKETDDLNFPYQ